MSADHKRHVRFFFRHFFRHFFGFFRILFFRMIFFRILFFRMVFFGWFFWSIADFSIFSVISRDFSTFFAIFREFLDFFRNPKDTLRARVFSVFVGRKVSFSVGHAAWHSPFQLRANNFHGIPEATDFCNFRLSGTGFLRADFLRADHWFFCVLTTGFWNFYYWFFAEATGFFACWPLIFVIFIPKNVPQRVLRTTLKRKKLLHAAWYSPLFSAFFV